MRFTKMEGLGNDYIYLNCMDGIPEDPAGLAVKLANRHFGVGSDGLIFIRPGKTGDFTMEMYNADGSRGAMCGNGIRCLGKYVYDKGLTRKTCLSVDTDAGRRELELHLRAGTVSAVTVDMGCPEVYPAVTLSCGGREYRAVPVSMGNPHGVIFCSELKHLPLERIGPQLECHPALPQRSNIEFAALPDRTQIEVRVWERGSGITLACGTGACAVFAAAHRAGLCESGVQVRLPGGLLSLELRGANVFMTGPANLVFEGELSL